MSFKNDLDPKFFQALLNGLSKQLFFGDQQFTHALLKEQLFAQSKMEAKAIDSLIELCERTLQVAASSGMDVKNLEDHLAGSDISEAHLRVFLTFWKTQEAAIHDKLVSKSQWGGTLKSIAWRIDMKTTSRGSQDISEPTALLELDIQQDENADKIQFEMNRGQVHDMLSQIETIEALIKRI